MNDTFEKSSGNIFVDIGDPEPERTLARAQVMSRIVDILEEKNLTQVEVAKILGIPQSKVSHLVNGKLSQFSLDHLFELLNTLGKDVEIIIKPSREDQKAKVRVLIE